MRAAGHGWRHMEGNPVRGPQIFCHSEERTILSRMELFLFGSTLLIGITLCWVFVGALVASPARAVRKASSRGRFISHFKR
jgi:hypothetical protein